MELVPTENFEACVNLGEQSMRPYFLENGLEWNHKERAALYSTLEIFEIFEKTSIGYLVLRESESCIFIADLQVVSELRNKGYGTKIVKMVKEMASKRGYSEIKLKVFKNNPAISLYTRNGFRKVSEEQHTYLFYSCV